MSEPAVKMYETRFGPMLGLTSDIYITRSLELYGEYCPGEWAMFKQLIKPGMTVVEIGANIGTHTVPMAKACAPGRLYAFEPQQRVFQVLCGNLALNDVRNVLAYPEGCGEESGYATVPPIAYEQANNFGGISLSTDASRGVRVRITPLDELDLRKLDVLKIDVEGFEPKVLRGARETILRCRPVIYIENDRLEQAHEVIQLIDRMGYQMYWHRPPLFDPQNYRGHTENVFGGVVSRNMLCIPNERRTVVQHMLRVDPSLWTSRAQNWNGVGA
ncbi:FkbM family methyltransferase [Phenylobacterium deserti]|uniref:FkbM family methyltransferase n=1 Tax=Phenylobacterium deserti TaxID=1914756 RepID=A0A328ABI1_9CAUL|nr:FkbM family methyltransferase [Phenylobacterium deserti]RAK52001.1 FkbM family methyltransferase [Phenylobacterium deserti]